MDGTLRAVSNPIGTDFIPTGIHYHKSVCMGTHQRKTPNFDYLLTARDARLARLRCIYGAMTETSITSLNGMKPHGTPYAVFFLVPFPPY